MGNDVEQTHCQLVDSGSRRCHPGIVTPGPANARLSGYHAGWAGPPPVTVDGSSCDPGARSPDPPDPLPFLRLALVGFAAKRALDRRLRRYRINALQYSILVRLHLSGPANLRHLAGDLGVTRQAIMVASRRLRRRDLVTVLAERSNARRMTLTLTDAGRCMKAELKPTVARLDRQTIGRIPSKRQHTFTDDLERAGTSMPTTPREMRWAE